MAASNSIKKTWFITGASSGLGLEMGLAALREGHRVIGTGRNIQKANDEHPEFAELGGEWLELDLVRPEAQSVIENFVSQEESRADGSVHWVLVNNAGYTVLGAVEDMSEDQITTYLQANVYGFIRVWKALLPHLRRHRQGTLVTISSIWGFVPKPEQMMYSAVKATTESLTESYASLLAPFGVRTLIIEPGGFRTPFAANNTKADGGISEDYKEAIQAWIDIVEMVGRDSSILGGHPQLFGERVLDAVEGRGLFKSLLEERGLDKAFRVNLGSDCYETHGRRLRDLNDSYAEMKDIAKSTDKR